MSFDLNHPNPTCGVVISKAGEQETICGEKAVDLTSLVDPDDSTRVTAVVLTCARHSEELEAGKTLVFTTEDQAGNPSSDRIAVQFVQKEEGRETNVT